MPCYTVNLITVSFKAKNITLLEKALETLNWNYSRHENIINVRGLFNINLDSQTVQTRENRQSDVNILKRKYSEMAIETMAKKKRWIVKQMNENTLRLRRY